MAKFPKYITARTHAIESGKIVVSLSVNRWGVPFLVWRCLREHYNLKWYHWLLYPWFCVRAWLRWGNGQYLH